jgi:hypothetical protein
MCQRAVAQCGMPAPFAAQFDHYAGLIAATDFAAIDSPAAIPAPFLLAREGRIEAHYIPFDHVNADARAKACPWPNCCAPPSTRAPSAARSGPTWWPCWTASA